MVPATVHNQDGQGCSAIDPALGGHTGSTVFVSANVEMGERVIARQDPVPAGVVSLVSSVTSLVLRVSGARTAP